MQNIAKLKVPTSLLLSIYSMKILTLDFISLTDRFSHRLEIDSIYTPLDPHIQTSSSHMRPFAISSLVAFLFLVLMSHLCLFSFWQPHKLHIFLERLPGEFMEFNYQSLDQLQYPHASSQLHSTLYVCVYI